MGPELIAIAIAYAKANPEQVALAVVAVSSAVADLTDTKKDDKFVAKYLKPVANFFALNWIKVLKELRK